MDPEWIEALNSVLDDNRLLTLPNGERISFGGSRRVNLVFETHSLECASPATVSRLGIISVSSEEAGRACLGRLGEEGCLAARCVSTYLADFKRHEVVATTVVGEVAGVGGREVDAVAWVMSQARC